MADEWDFTKPQILEEGMKYTPIPISIDPVKRCYEIPNNVLTDLELMCVLAQVHADYAERMTEAELQAAMDWFKCWTVAQLEKT